MNINKQRVRRQFNRHAHEYDQYAQVQKEMADQLFNKLTSIARSTSGFQNILEIGCGTGYLTEKLVKQYPEANVVVVDIAEEMVALTTERLGERSTNLITIVEDAEWFVDSQHSNPIGNLNLTFDLIISNATFQWFNNAKTTIQGYLKYLDPNGILAFTTFGPRTFHELHTSFAQAELQLGMSPQSHGQTFCHLQDWHDYITPFAELVHSSEQSIVEMFPTVKQFLYHIKKIGAGNATHAQGESHLGLRNLMKLMEQYYVQQYSVEQGIEATYHLCMGIYKS